MARTVKVKKREHSLHSRAARRGEQSPPPNAAPAKSSLAVDSEYKPWLHSAQNAGISQRKKNKQLSRQQKLRQQRGLEQAVRNTERMEKKVADSKTRARRVQARAKAWEELNEALVEKEAKDAVTARTVVDAENDAESASIMTGVEEPDARHSPTRQLTDVSTNGIQSPGETSEGQLKQNLHIQDPASIEDDVT